MSSAAVLSPAKINLLLKVLRKREDGYHEIFSVMQPVTLYDNITIEAEDGEGITIDCRNADIPTDPSNLAHRAARLFLEKTGLKKHIKIVIDKRIPVGAGLGGGSSNAATVLMSLNSMLNAGLSEDELRGMGAALGSDVPFFILKGPAVATGRGEVLKRVSLPECHYILINPGFHVSTPWVYGNLGLTKKNEDNILSYSCDAIEECGDISKMLANDLETVTAVRHPEVLRLKNLLMESGAAGALMSGSGPTVFGLFVDNGRARAAFEAIRPVLDEKSSIFLVQGIEGGG